MKIALRLNWARDAGEYTPAGKRVGHVLDRYDLKTGWILSFCGRPIKERVTLTIPPRNWPPTTVQCEMCMHEIERRINADAYAAFQRELDLLHPDLADRGDEPGFC